MMNFGRLFSMALILMSFSFVTANCPGGEDVCLSLQGSSLNYNSSADIFGFQFNHDGCASGASGGDAADNGFTVSSSAGVVLAFSFTGSSIPAGDGTLVDLGSEDCTESTLTGFIFSDASGGPMTFAWSQTPTGCMDEAACNYDPIAEEDDGSCEYESDCFGECGGTAVDDCAGECGGSAVEDCAGECGGSAVEDCAGECGGSAVEDCAGECGGSAVEDICGECGGTQDDETQCVEEGYSLSIGNVDPSAGTMDIIMNNEGPVAGFQFDVTGADLLGAAGGSAESSGFQVSTSASGVVLGFSFSGDLIPSANTLLTTLSFENLSESVCLSDPILSDSSGEPLEVTLGDCFEGFGCTDEAACNYDPDAVVNDNSCAYEFDCFDECGGTAVVDCAGECGGSAVEDCNGDCDGTALVDCNGVCDGTASVDCAGVCCDGDTGVDCTVDDVCGECGGTETDEDNCWDSNGLWVQDFTATSDTTATLEIYMSNLTPVAGFEFRLTSTLDGFALNGGSGGEAELAGFEVSTSSSGMVLGFSFTGATIEYGFGLLTSIDVNLSSTSDMMGYIYLSDVVIADPSGNEMNDFNVPSYYSVGGAPDTPMAPANLTAQLVELNSIDVGWDASDYADSYTVYRNGIPITTTSSTSLFQVDLDYETTYTYYVTASNGAGESGMSNEAQVTTGLEPFDPIPPSGLTATGMDEKVVLAWGEPQAFPDAVDCQGQEFDPFDPVYSSYDCLVCGLANDAGEICGEDLGSACLDWLGDTYCDDGAFGYWFDCETFGCDCGDCGMDCEDPFGFCDTVTSNIPDSKTTGELTDYQGSDDSNAEDNNSNTNTRQEVTEYQLYMSATSGSGYELVGTTDASTFTYTVMELENGTEYYFVAKAVFLHGEETLISDFSNEVSAIPVPFQAPVPENLEAMPGDSEIALSWDFVNSDQEEAFVGYNVYYSMSMGGEYMLLSNLTGQVTEYTHSGLDNGISYYYVVTSQFEDTESSYSNEVSASPMDMVNISLTSSEGLFAQGSEFTVTISIDNPSEVAGFQTVLKDNPECASVIGVNALGALDSLGFTVNDQDPYGDNSDAIILAFSLTGAVMPVNAGDILEVTYQVNEDADGGECAITVGDAPDGSETVLSDSEGNAFFFTAGSTSVDIAYEANFALIQASDTEFMITMSNSADVGALQFLISDDPDYYSYVDADNGSALSGFTTSGGDSDGDFEILSFNLTGGSVAPGLNQQVLIVEMENNAAAPDTSFVTELCFAEIVVSDPLAQSIAAGSMCSTFTYPYDGPGIVEGCTDPESCTYNSEAQVDDGSCEYNDCFGECGGSAVEDECGECGGDGPDDGFDCDGNELSNDTIIPTEFTIGQVYPNPFNPSTTIDWGMKYGSTHRLEIYNTSGQLVDILSQGYINAGYHSVSWNGQNQSSGIYIVRLIADGMFVSSRKIMLVK